MASIGGFLITGHENGETRLWQTSNFQEVGSLRISQFGGRANVSPGFDDQHFFARNFSFNHTPEQNALRYWRIPADLSAPILEWERPLGFEYSSQQVLRDENIIIFGQNNGFLVSLFDAQGNATEVPYNVNDRGFIAVSDGGETIAVGTLNQIQVWQGPFTSSPPSTCLPTDTIKC